MKLIDKVKPEILSALEKDAKINDMRRLIYDMYYAEEISVDIAIKLLDKLTQIRDKRKRY